MIAGEKWRPEGVIIDDYFASIGVVFQEIPYV